MRILLAGQGGRSGKLRMLTVILESPVESWIFLSREEVAIWDDVLRRAVWLNLVGNLSI